MKYQSLADFRWGWTFRHRELPIDSETLERILPLSQQAANQYWKTNVSKEAAHASLFLGDDWPSRNGVWQPKTNWESSWESDSPALPEELAEHCQWEDNVTVFYCYDTHNVVQTQWGVFKRHWKNFLFVDDGTLLLAKGRDQVVRFFSDGNYQVGIKPEK